jgi:riboflavin synthase
MAATPPGSAFDRANSEELKIASRKPHTEPMFTGIVEETGSVERIQPSDKSIELTIRSKLCGRGLKVGDSLAINGCCLTVVKLSARGSQKRAQFDLLKETWDRTNLRFANVGSLVNLERPLRANGSLG